MSSKKEIKPIFEIQDSDINISEIMAEIESSLKKRNLDSNEIARITKLRLTPETPEGERQFDPAGTAHSFEKGINPPSFTNPIFKYIRGPLRWLFVKFIEGYSLFDKKVSENRIKAFFSVIYELVLLRKKYEVLEKKFLDFHREHIELKAYVLGKKEIQSFYNPNKPLESGTEKSNERILDMIHSGDKTLVIFPEYDNLLQKFKLKQIPFLAIVNDKREYDYFLNNITSDINLVHHLEEYQNYSGFKNIFLAINACKLPGWLLEKLIFSIRKYSDSETKIFFRYSNSSLNFHTPFQENLQSKISNELLFHFLRETGYKNIVRHTVEDGELSLITFNKV
jgi:hypothetical protein